MYFVEYTYSVGLIAYGSTIVFDESKYCSYSFSGISKGYSPVPLCFIQSCGYVYNVKEIEDFEGFFLSCAGAVGPYCVGGAVAENGVYSEITGGIVRSGVGSIGGSILWYEAEQTDWYYDPIPWKKEISPYDKFIPAERYVKGNKNDVRFFTIEKL